MIETIEEENFLWMFDPCNINNKHNFYCDAKPALCEDCEKYDFLVKFQLDAYEMLEDFRNNIWTM